MQLGALINTRRRKWAMIVLGVVVCAAAVWLLLDVFRKPTDEEKFQRMLRNERWESRLQDFRTRHKVPGPVDKHIFMLETRWIAESRNLREELVASGYLVSFPVTNVFSRMLILRYGTIPFSDQVVTNCYVSSYSEGAMIFITCRSNDAGRIHALVEKLP